MKRFFLSIFLFLPVFAFSLSNRELSDLSDFRLMGDQTLYEKPEFSKEAEWHKTFNHEGGLKVRVMERGERDEKEDGTWYYVLLTAPVYIETWELLKPHQKFWIFIRDDEKIFEYEE